MPGENAHSGGRLTFLQKLTYGMGNMGGNFVNFAFSLFILVRFEAYGPYVWFSIIMLVGRIVDSVADPLIGYWSDRARTRWGRRIPFMMFGGLPLSLVFFLIWVPPLDLFPQGSTSLFIYLSFLMGAFWFLFTAVLCPYLALLPEIAANEHERLQLAEYMAVFMLISSGVVMIVLPGLKDLYGYVGMALIVAVLTAISVYSPVLTIRETYARQPESYSVFTALKWTFSNRAFVIFVVSSVFLQIAFQTIIMSMEKIVTVILGKPGYFLGIIMGGAGLNCVISFFLINVLAERYDKGKIYMAGMLVFVLLLPFIYIFGQYDLSVDLAFIGVDFVVSELITAFFIFGLTGFPIAVLMVLPPSILSDIIDLDELNTGERREAMYFGAQGFLQKGGLGLCGFIIGILFQLYGANTDNHLGLDLLGPVTAVFVLIGFIIYLWYPLDRKRVAEIKLELARRKQAAGGGAISADGHVAET